MSRNTRASRRFYSGDYLVISDISGQKFLRSECRFDWRGLLMHKSEWSIKHPQIDLRGHPDDISVKDPRPRQPDTWEAGQSPTDQKVQVANAFGNLPGAVTDGFTTPSAVANTPTGSFSIKVELAPEITAGGGEHTMIAKADSTSNSYLFRVRNVNSLDLVLSGSLITSDSFDLQFGQQRWVAFEYDSPAENVIFYQSLTGSNFQVISEHSIPVSSPYISSDPVFIGSRRGLSSPFPGRIYEAQLIEGDLDGEILMDFNPQDYDFNTVPTSWETNTGETWTIRGNSTVDGTVII